MTSADSVVFRMDLSRAMATRLGEFLQRVIDSEALKASMTIELDVDGENVLAHIVFPQYWAVYYHDGRGPVRPRNGKFIVFFQDVEQDPRVANGYPTRATDIQKLNLTKEQFKELIASGELIVRRSVGPAPAHRFMDRLAGGQASAKVATLVKNEFRGHVQAALGHLMDIQITHRF